MSVIQNQMKQKMLNGKFVASLNANRWKSVDIAEIAAISGFDWLFIDLEHSVLSEEMAGQIALMSLRTGVTPIARVGTDQWYQASRVLDAGCQGVVFPHIDTVEQAVRAVSAVKYPPLGLRSLSSPCPQAYFGKASSVDAMQKLNEETLVIVMVETQQSLDALDKICAVPGVDGVMIGTNDLAATLGHPGELGHKEVVEAYAHVGAICKKHHVFFGMGGVYNEALIRQYLSMGVQFMLGGADISLLMDAAKIRRDMIVACTPS
jgi:2-keto-3-deoxy-L-rhamnonate aldolase RhmA